MKYIRTKNGQIFEVEKDLGKYGKSKAVIICDFDGNFIDVESQNMILKEAGTIEELCNEFVAVNESETPHLVSIYERDDEKYLFEFGYPTEYLIKDFLKTYKIYGAIWTDKGLIYVAKMNEKGELELL